MSRLFLDEAHLESYIGLYEVCINDQVSGRIYRRPMARGTEIKAVMPDRCRTPARSGCPTLRYVAISHRFMADEFKKKNKKLRICQI